MSVAEKLPAESWLAEHRAELTGYCYRMLGSPFDAEDAVQETLVRAWRGYDRFEGRSSLRSWLYRIATNVCLDARKAADRRARPMDLAPPSAAGEPLGPPLPEAWVEPIPDDRLDPADLVVSRETISLAFVAALQRLTPPQRAVLILRDVLCLRAREVAEALDTTVASVNSSLQRARAVMAEREVTAAEPYSPTDPVQRDLLARYVDAFARYDVDALIALMHEDITMTMPPFSWWLRGRDQMRQALLGSDGSCRRARWLPTVANGLPAFGQYRADDQGGEYRPFALQVLEVASGRILATTTFLDAERLFPLFALPPSLDA
ncbi:sigma-70 family RNA polymerase sigma factor [Pseudonocardia acaciae]|uniref:sigma-70 family RNA polymerase sigma factor n=1 Tax=Pseudonocardia acaciae TaxID=551276 RepID=UPI00056390B9|nr:sigma-70 family RNA polymerase sigma factor [Pseudonocardia acaciae]